jgi:hypothetical protein
VAPRFCSSSVIVTTAVGQRTPQMPRAARWCKVPQDTVGRLGDAAEGRHWPGAHLGYLRSVISRSRISPYLTILTIALLDSLVNLQDKIIWQQAAGDTDVDYADLCLRWGVILNGPAQAGPWPDCRETLAEDGWSSKKLTDLRRFAEEVAAKVQQPGVRSALALRLSALCTAQARP